MLRWKGTNPEVVRIPRESERGKILDHARTECNYWALQRKFHIAGWYSRYFRYYYNEIIR